MSKTLGKIVMTLALIGLVIPAAGCRPRLGGSSSSDSGFGFDFDFGSLVDGFEFFDDYDEYDEYDEFYDDGYDDYDGYDDFWFDDDDFYYDDWKRKTAGKRK